MSAVERAGIVCVSAERAAGSGTAYVDRDSPSPIGSVREGHRPGRTVGQIVGTQGGTWLLLEVTPAGSVQLRTVYAEGGTVWGSFSGSLCYAT